MSSLQRLAGWAARHTLALLLATFVLLAGTSSIVVPPFETPDEIWHFAFIQQLATGGGLPVSEPRTEAMWRQQGAQAPGYYLVGAALTAWIDQSDFPALYARANPHAAIGMPEFRNQGYLLHYPEDGWPWQGSILALHLVRLFSVLLGAITLWATYQILHLLLERQLALLGTALVAFIPQFIFISGAASNDNAINAVAALLLWRLVRLLRDAPVRGAPDPDRLREPLRNPRPYLLLGLLVGLALLAKVSGLWLLPLSWLVIGAVAYRAGSGRLFWQGALLVGAMAMLVGGWWLARNWLLYGDLLAVEIWRSNILLRPEPADWRVILSEWESLDHSFWGLFGWFNVAYPTRLYRLFQFLELLILFGLLLTLVRWIRRGREGFPALEGWRGASVALLLIWLLMLVLSWLGFMRIAPAAQGRYFHPALPSLALLMVVGLRAWRLRPTDPPYLAQGVLAFLATLSLITPWWLIRPAYLPSSPLQTLPAGATAVEVQFGELMRLEGFTLAPFRLTPSQPMELTLYWRALRPIDQNYSISVKGFGRDGQLIARDDSYPDGGRWPTRLWEPGQLIADRKKIWISGQTVTPTLGRIKVDVYELENLQMLPAMVGGEPVASPVSLVDVVVREAGAAPGEPRAFRFRPLVDSLDIRQGEVVLDFAWEVGQSLEGDYQALFHLSPGLDQKPVATGDFPPVGGDFPTSHWWPGDRLADHATLPLPSELPEGDYLLLLGLYDLASLHRVEAEAGRELWQVGRLSWDGTDWTLQER